MPFAYVGAAVGVASAVNGLANSGGGSTGGFSGGSSPPQAYIPTGQATADAQYQALNASEYPFALNIPTQTVPTIEAAGWGQVNNPYQGMAQGAANAAGQYGTGTLSPQMTSGATSLFGLGNTGSPYGARILQTGFDPQNSLYNSTVQHVTDQSNAINSMYGLGSSPAGAGLTQNTIANFNMDWQNQQLQRQAEAAQGYGNIVSGVGQAYSGGANLGVAGQSELVSSGALPYNTYNTGQGNIINALNSVSSGAQNAFGLTGNELNALAAYLKLGQSATTVGQAGAAQNASNNAALGSALGSSLNNLSGLFGKGGSSTGQTGYGTGSNSGYQGVGGSYGASSYGSAGYGASLSGGFY